jgi:glutamine amidotransferase PdxT
MEKVLKLGHVGMGTGAVKPFDQIYKASKLCTKLDDINECDALVIWGGADISPTIYNEPVGPRTGATEQLTRRDMVEVAACNRAIERGIPVLGVCRGAQLLCALAGGKLVQDVQGHGVTHNVTTDDGRSISTSSMHHQMMYPWDVEHHLIAWSSEPRSKTYEGVDIMPMWRDDDFFVEPEVVWFPKIKGLAIQGHPEFMDEKCEFVQYCMELTRKYILKEVSCEC